MKTRSFPLSDEVGPLACCAATPAGSDEAGPEASCASSAIAPLRCVQINGNTGILPQERLKHYELAHTGKSRATDDTSGGREYPLSNRRVPRQRDDAALDTRWHCCCPQ